MRKTVVLVDECVVFRSFWTNYLFSSSNYGFVDLAGCSLPNMLGHLYTALASCSQWQASSRSRPLARPISTFAFSCHGSPISSVLSWLSSRSTTSIRSG